MKVIVAGSKTIVERWLVENAIRESPFYSDTSEIVCAAARGVDQSGRMWAEEKGIPVEEFKPDWNKHSKVAGPIRNAKMADALIAVWDGESRGAKEMIDKAVSNQLETSVKIPESKMQTGGVDE